MHVHSGSPQRQTPDDAGASAVRGAVLPVDVVLEALGREGPQTDAAMSMKDFHEPLASAKLGMVISTSKPSSPSNAAAPSALVCRALSTGCRRVWTYGR